MARDYFRKHRIILRFLGILLPGDLKDKRALRLIISSWFYYMALLFPLLATCFGLGVLFYSKQYKFTFALYGISGVFSSTCVAFKYLTIAAHRKDVKELTDALRGVKADTRIGKVTTIMANATEALAIMQRLVLLREIIAVGKVRMIMPFWTPFPRDDFTVAICTYIFVQVSAGVKTLTNFFIDTLILRISNQICHRLLILSNTYQLVGLTEEEKAQGLRARYVLELPKGMDPTDQNLLKLCAREHQTLIGMVDKLGVILNKLFLPQVTNAFLSLCLVLFVCTQSDNMIAEAAKCIPWTVMTGLQLFVSCFSGELIKQRYHDVFLSSYSNGWYGCEKKIRTSLLIVQTYTSKPKVMKGAYVFELSLHTFETIAREIFSTFTVVYQLFNTK